MRLNFAQKLIKSHLLSGAMTVGKEIGIRIDQTLTQDATGTLVMLELESMGSRHGHRGRAVLCRNAIGLGDQTHGKASRLGISQRCHPGDAAPSQDRRRQRQNHRVLWTRTDMPVGDGPPHYRKHGRRTWCDDLGISLGRRDTPLPETPEARTDWIELKADPDAIYDLQDEIDLSKLEPLIAMPSNPDNVVPVREVAGTEVYQTYIGSSANPGYRDFAIVAEMVRGRTAHPRVSLDINPSSRQIPENLIRDGYIGPLVHAGARLRQAGCNGCIGMGQAPATDTISLRTVPRNFPGRSGHARTKCVLSAPKRLRHRH